VYDHHVKKLTVPTWKPWSTQSTKVPETGTRSPAGVISAFRVGGVTDEVDVGADDDVKGFGV